MRHHGVPSTLQPETTGSVIFVQCEKSFLQLISNVRGLRENVAFCFLFHTLYLFKWELDLARQLLISCTVSQCKRIGFQAVSCLFVLVFEFGFGHRLEIASRYHAQLNAHPKVHVFALVDFIIARVVENPCLY